MRPLQNKVSSAQTTEGILAVMAGLKGGPREARSGKATQELLEKLAGAMDEEKRLKCGPAYCDVSAATMPTWMVWWKRLASLCQALGFD